MKSKTSKFSVYHYIIFAVEFIVATVITFAGYYYAPRILYFYRTKKLMGQIQHVADVVKSDYSVYTKYNRISNGRLATIAKEELQNDGLIFHYDNIVSSYHGGNLIVFPSAKTAVTSQTDAFILGYGALWRDRCILLATYDWRKIKGVTPIAVLASSMEQHTQILDEAYTGCSGRSLLGNYALACVNSSSSNFPMTLEEAQTACSCEGNSCFIAVKFY